jgi:hypothetical protein
MSLQLQMTLRYDLVFLLAGVFIRLCLGSSMVCSISVPSDSYLTISTVKSFTQYKPSEVSALVWIGRKGVEQRIIRTELSLSTKHPSWIASPITLKSSVSQCSSTAFS